MTRPLRFLLALALMGLGQTFLVAVWAATYIKQPLVLPLGWTIFTGAVGVFFGGYFIRWASED